MIKLRINDLEMGTNVQLVQEIDCQHIPNKLEIKNIIQREILKGERYCKNIFN